MADTWLASLKNMPSQLSLSDLGQALQGQNSQDQAAMQPETFANPAVDAMIRGTAQSVATPGILANAQNPYPPGSEQYWYFENSRNQAAQDWANQTALNRLTPAR